MRFWLVVGLYLLFQSASSAQEVTESGWPSGGAMDTGFVFNKELDVNMELLNKEHTKLITMIKEYDPDNNSLIDAVKKQHEAWLQYYPNECYISGRLSNSGGSWPSTYSVICSNEIVKERIKKIASIEKCIKDVPISQTTGKIKNAIGLADEKNACLYQLGNMILQLPETN